MKTLNVCLTGFVLLIVGAFLFSLVPSAGYAQQAENDITKQITVMTNGECPAGKFDQTLGHCTVARHDPEKDITKAIDP